MTLLEVTYALRAPLSMDELRRIAQFANTYGLRRFRVDEANHLLSFEYDGSRLRETQVAQVLGRAGVAVKHRVN
jgi:hypothetical protein